MLFHIAFWAGCFLLSGESHVLAQATVCKDPGMINLLTAVRRSGPNPAVMEQVTEQAGARKDGEKPSVLSKEALEQYCERISRDRSWLFFTQSRYGKMKIRMCGVYTHGSTLFFLLRVSNRSPLDYEVDSVRFFIDEAPRTLIQWLTKTPPVRTPFHPKIIPLRPVFVYDSLTSVKAYGRGLCVLAFPRFTLPRGRRLFIEITERNGGRLLCVTASNFVLERARFI